MFTCLADLFIAEADGASGWPLKVALMTEDGAMVTSSFQAVLKEALDCARSSGTTTTTQTTAAINIMSAASSTTMVQSTCAPCPACPVLACAISPPNLFSTGIIFFND